MEERLDAVETPPDADPQFAELIEAIKADAKMFTADEVAEALMQKVCIPYDSREAVFIMETGEKHRAQPFRLTDSEYMLVTEATMLRVLKETKVDEIEWQAEKYDCEKISKKLVMRCIELGLNSVGRVTAWSGEHAFCIAAVRDGKHGINFMCIEPQTDQIVVPNSEQKYNISNALMILS